MLLVFVIHKGFKLYPIDVKLAFLNSFVKEVYIKQSSKLEHLDYPNHIFKILYGLKQAPTTWYDKLSTF